MEWIDVNDKLPQNSDAVIAWHSVLKKPIIAYFFDYVFESEWIFDYGDGTVEARPNEITHWYSIPQQP